MSSPSKNAFAIPPFDGSKERWLLWRERIKAAMTGRGWWKYVEKDPHANSAVASILPADAEAALSALILALPDELLAAYGVGATDAAVVWKKLCSHFESASLVNQAHLRSKLMNHRMTSGMTYLHYYTEMMSIVRSLKGMGVHVDDADVLHKQDEPWEWAALRLQPSKKKRAAATLPEGNARIPPPPRPTLLFEGSRYSAASAAAAAAPVDNSPLSFSFTSSSSSPVAGAAAAPLSRGPAFTAASFQSPVPAAVAAIASASASAGVPVPLLAECGSPPRLDLLPCRVPVPLTTRVAGDRFRALILATAHSRQCHAYWCCRCGPHSCAYIRLMPATA